MPQLTAYYNAAEKLDKIEANYGENPSSLQLDAITMLNANLQERINFPVNNLEPCNNWGFCYNQDRGNGFIFLPRKYHGFIDIVYIPNCQIENSQAQAVKGAKAIS